MRSFPWKHPPGTRYFKQLNLSCFSKTVPFFHVNVVNYFSRVCASVPSLHHHACMPSPLRYIRCRQAGVREPLWQMGSSSFLNLSGCHLSRCATLSLLLAPHRQLSLLRSPLAGRPTPRLASPRLVSSRLPSGQVTCTQCRLQPLVPQLETIGMWDVPS